MQSTTAGSQAAWSTIYNYEIGTNELLETKVSLP